MPGKHFLIIDLDDASLGRLDKNVLTPAGHTITTTTRPDRIPTGEFDMIVLGDHSGGNPLDRLEPLRHAHPASPVLLLSQRNQSGKLTLQAIQHGAFACLAVPIQVDEVMTAVSRGLALRRQLETWSDQRIAGVGEDELSRLRIIEKSTRMGRSVATVLDFDRVLAAIVRAAVEVAGAENGMVMLLPEGGGEPVIRAAYHFEDDAVRMMDLPVVDALAGRVIETGKPVLLDGSLPEAIRARDPVYSLVYVPLIVNDRVAGVLGIDNREQRRTVFNQGHIAALSTLAEFAAAALENARHYSLAEAERKKIEGIVLTVADGVIVVDEAGRVVLLNPRAREIFALEDRDYTGQPIGAVLAFPELTAAIAETGQSVVRRFELEPEEKRHYIAQVNPLPGLGKTITIQDVTHFKELDSVKSEFVTTISHDLRSPLTAILGYVELIGRVGEANPQQREFMNRIQASVHSITELINALLELGRIEAGFDQHKEQLPLQVILRYAVDDHKRDFDEKNQKVVLDIEKGLPVIFGSHIRLRQLVAALLENACRYSPEGSRVTIRAYAEGDQVILEVSDNGIGIPASDLPFVFDKLYRGSNVPMDTVGTGLGLSIVRSIAANHGGRLWCESELGKGTTVTVVLPAAQ
jgi:two-component system NtrC family sensor kinase